MLATGLPEDAGFRIAFLVGAGSAVVAALSDLLIPGRHHDSARSLSSSTPVRNAAAAN